MLSLIWRIFLRGERPCAGTLAKAPAASWDPSESRRGRPSGQVPRTLIIRVSGRAFFRVVITR